MDMDSPFPQPDQSSTGPARQGSSCLHHLADLPGPKGLPLLGNALQLDAKRFHATLERWADQYGPCYRMDILLQRFLVVSDRDAIVRLLRDRPEGMRRSTRTVRVIEEGGTYGLFSAEGEEWRKQRKLVMRALTPEVLRNFFPTLAVIARRLQRRWIVAVAAGNPVDVLRDLKAFTLDVTIALAMGQDINTLEHEDNPLPRDIEFLFRCIARRMTSPFPYWRYLRLPADRAADAASGRIREAVSGFIGQARRRLEMHPELRARPSNMLEALVVARDEPGSTLTDEHIIGNAITMVFAGEDTTSNTIAWLTDLLARHPEAMARVTAEADAILGEGRVAASLEQFEDMTFIEAAIHEAMRLKPVAVVMGAEPNQDCTIADVLVPAGTPVLCLMRHRREWDPGLAEPDAFRPERWLSSEELGYAGDPTRKLLPFGAGPRYCPGRYVAMAQIKMVIAMLAHNFRLTLADGAAPVEERFTFTMTPATLPVVLSAREG